MTNDLINDTGFIFIDTGHDGKTGEESKVRWRVNSSSSPVPSSCPPYAEIDEKIRPLVMAINSRGIKTSASCSGHWIDGYDGMNLPQPSPWISMPSDPKTNARGQIQSLKRLIKEFNRTNNIQWNLFVADPLDYVLSPEKKRDFWARCSQSHTMNALEGQQASARKLADYLISADTPAPQYFHTTTGISIPGVQDYESSQNRLSVAKGGDKAADRIRELLDRNINGYIILSLVNVGAEIRLLKGYRYYAVREEVEIPVRENRAVCELIMFKSLERVLYAKR